MCDYARAFQIGLPIEISLNDKVAMVTGSGRGIGKVVALELARAGARLLVNDLRRENCADTAREVNDLGREIVILEGDVSYRNQVESMMNDGLTSFGRIDILINNAGVIFRKPFTELSEEEWDRTIDVNLKGSFLCSQAVSRNMIESGKGGKIINISSIMGEVALPPRSAYCASKGGLISLTRELAIELAEHHITVNSIAPGWVETELTSQYFSQKQVRDYLLERTPLRRFCQPSEIATLATYLASDLADFITGQTIFVDGGWTAL